MIDLHCHIDLYPDPVAVLDEAERRGVFVLAVTTTPKAWRGTNALVANRRRVRVALGLHPEVAAARRSEVALLCGLLPEARYVGEIGIDGSPPHRQSVDVQTQIFCRILAECENHGGRILSVHSRGAAQRVLDAVADHPRAGMPILHWFSGTKADLKRAVDLGCWFSVGPAMVRSQKGRDLVAAIPIDRLLTETDAPFAREGDRPLYPWEATSCLPAIALAQGIDVETLARQVSANLRSLGAWMPERRASGRP